MLKRCYLLILIVFFLAGCAHHMTKIAVPYSAQNPAISVKQYRQVEPIYSD